jgi:hypothetical protein
MKCDWHEQAEPLLVRADSGVCNSSNEEKRTATHTQQSQAAAHANCFDRYISYINGTITDREFETYRTARSTAISIWLSYQMNKRSDASLFD